MNDTPFERKIKIDDLGRAYATGKRKQHAVARVWIKEGSGQLIINKKNVNSVKNYSLFHNYYKIIVNAPFVVAGISDKFDVWCTVKGGGYNGQLEAIKYGIAKALVNFNPSFYKLMRDAGLLTRDSRIVESKKYGHKKARKSFQFSKR